MPCVRFGKGIVCYSNTYEYEGFTFEDHRFLGPVRLRKRTLEPLDKDPPNRFWNAYRRFRDEDDRSKFLVA